MSIPGGWTVFTSMDDESANIFNQAMSGLVGVGYTPICYASQLVNGTNYCYICKSVVMSNPPTEYFSKVIVYDPINGDPVITSIEHII